MDNEQRKELNVELHIVKLGFVRQAIDLDFVKRRSSKLFSVKLDRQQFGHLGNPESEEGFKDEELEALLAKESEPHVGLLIALADVPLSGGYYLRRLKGNRVVISVYEVSQALESHHVPIENFLLRQLYHLAFAFVDWDGKLPPSPPADGGVKLSHDEVRNCIFDFNVNRFHVVHSSNRPIVCKSCEDGVRSQRLKALLPAVNKELQSIRRPLYWAIHDFVQHRPLFSLAIASLFGILLNVLASFTYDWIKPQASSTQPVHSLRLQTQ